MGKRNRLREPRQCDKCGVEADIQFRVWFEDKWHIVCKQCQLEASDASDYMYGGTWKRKKRN